MEDVMAQQVKLLGPGNLKTCLSGYLAPIYPAKMVLTRKEAQDYRLTLDRGDPEADEEADEEANQETETDLDADQEPVPNTIGELQEPLEEHAEAHSGERTQSR
jgi:hypothetical protein